jgi:hypothetical protein
LNIFVSLGAHDKQQQLLSKLQLAFITFSTIFLKELLSNIPICNPFQLRDLSFLRLHQLTLYFFSIPYKVSLQEQDELFF